MRGKCHYIGDDSLKKGYFVMDWQFTSVYSLDSLVALFFEKQYSFVFTFLLLIKHLLSQIIYEKRFSATAL